MNSIFKKLLAVGMAAVIMAGAMAGCGDEASDNSNGNNTQNNTASDNTNNASSNGGETVLNFGCVDYVDSVDPVSMINGAWNCSRFGIGECLFRFDDEMVAQPYLCDSYEVSEDHLTWTFHIRDGVKFSSGADCNAEAVVASLERLYADADKGSSTPEKYMEYSSITADAGENTVTIVTTKAYADLTKNLAYPVFVILDTANTTDYTEGAIGTGPYAVTKFEAQVGVSFVANEYYWNGDVPFDRMELKFVNDSSAKAMAIQSGQLDLVENVTTISDLNSLKENDNYTVTIAPGVRCGFAYMNQNGVLGNDTLRKAILMAIDDTTLCTVSTGGLYTEGFSVLPSNLDYNYDQLNDPYSYNVEQANKILDDAGIVDTDGDGIRELDGKNIVLKYVTYENRCLDIFAQGIQIMLKEIGIGIDLMLTDGDTQWNMLVSGEYDLNGNNWTTVGTGDPTEYLDNWYGKSTANYCGYQNDEYDALYEELLDSLDNNRRKEIITRLQQILVDDAAVLVHGYYNSSMCASNDTIGYAAIHTADYYWITNEITPAS